MKIDASQTPRQSRATWSPAGARALAGLLRDRRRTLSLPALLVVLAAVGIWYFVFRTDATGQVDKLLEEAHAALGTFEYSQAEQKIKKAIQIAPGSGVLHHNLGAVFMRQGRKEEAREAFERAAALYGPAGNELRAEELWQLAQLDFDEAKWPQAEQHLELAIASHPTRTLLHTRLIDLQLTRLDKKGAADSSTARFLTACGTSATNLRDVAYVHYQRRSLKTALALASAATKKDDSLVDAHVIVANSHWKTGQIDAGLASLEAPLQRHPRAPDLWVARASLFVAGHRYDAALAAVQVALDLEPNHYKAHVARLMALSEAGRYEEALAAARRCSELTEDENEERFLSGQVERIEARRSGKHDPQVPGTPDFEAKP